MSESVFSSTSPRCLLAKRLVLAAEGLCPTTDRRTAGKSGEAGQVFWEYFYLEDLFPY